MSWPANKIALPMEICRSCRWYSRGKEHKLGKYTCELISTTVSLKRVLPNIEYKTLFTREKGGNKNVLNLI